MAIPVILDCDPGHDDAFAIMLAAANPAIDLLAVTTVAGNQTLDKTTLNARRIMTAAGISGVPVASGRDRPLLAPERLVAADIHGESGMDGPSFGEPTVPVVSTDAVGFMHEILERHPSPVTLVATGPFTNVAALLLAHPSVRLERIVVMGGSTERGNVTPAAEFNIYADPEAAQIVFGSGVPVTMVGLNVTHQVLATPSVLARIADVGTPLATICVELLTFFASTYRTVFGFESPPLHDPLTIASLIDPAVLTCVPVPVTVELNGTATRGATVVDLDLVTGAAPNCDVAVGVDPARFWDLMIAAIQDLGA
jgi:inosine-uridine nucleoside N-ribohydrolase